MNGNAINGISKSSCENDDNDEISMKPVSNVKEFLLTWKIASQNNNYELYHKLLRSIKPKDLPRGKYYGNGYPCIFTLHIVLT